jgi:hypothetical protein
VLNVNTKAIGQLLGLSLAISVWGCGDNNDLLKTSGTEGAGGSDSGSSSGDGPKAPGGGLDPALDLYKAKCIALSTGDVSWSTDGALCELVDLVSPCQIDHPERAGDSSIQTSAEIRFPISLLRGGVDNKFDLNGTARLSVELDSEVDVGYPAAFAIRLPASTAEVSVFRAFRVRTFLGGSVQEESDDHTPITADLLNSYVVGGQRIGLLGFVAQRRYDRIDLEIDATVVSLDLLGVSASVYGVCVGAER